MSRWAFCCHSLFWQKVMLHHSYVLTIALCGTYFFHFKNYDSHSPVASNVGPRNWPVSSAIWKKLNYFSGNADIIKIFSLKILFIRN